MTEAGFFAQKRSSPKSLAMVIALHAAVFAAVVMIKSPQFIRDRFGRTEVTFVPINPDPPPEPQRPVEHATPQSRPTVIDQTDPVVQTNPDNSMQVASGENVTRFVEDSGGGDRVLPPPPPPPFRRAADFDPRYANALQPPYPATEERAQRDGVVRVRVTIGPDGRVTAVERLTATSDAFWRVTEQQALRHWRFRPATLDGRPVEDSKVVTLNFRIADL